MKENAVIVKLVSLYTCTEQATQWTFKRDTLAK